MRAVPNAESPPCLLHTFLKSRSFKDMLHVIPLFTSQSNAKESVHPILGSKAITAWTLLPSAIILTTQISLFFLYFITSLQTLLTHSPGHNPCLLKSYIYWRCSPGWRTYMWHSIFYLNKKNPKNFSNAYSCNTKVHYALNCFKALFFLPLLTTLLPDATLLTHTDSSLLNLLQPCAVTPWKEFYLLIFAALC